MSNRRQSTNQTTELSEEQVLDNIEKILEIEKSLEDLEKSSEVVVSGETETEAPAPEQITKEPVKKPLNPDGTRFKSKKIFLGEKDRRDFERANRRIMNILGIKENKPKRM